MNLKISKHTDARDADGCGYAINVKDWRRDHKTGGTESQREQAHDSAREAWWGNATSIAVEHGFAGAYAGGRSGGWCIPYYETNGRTRYAHTTDADIAELGDDATEAERDEAKRFNSFAADIESLYNAFPALFADELERIMDADAIEAEEAQAAAEEKIKMQTEALAILQSANATECADYWRAAWGTP